ncbi:MAG: glycosyltransferase [Alphaproteobacteria bacterium]|nr:glycosyltransferase [Alphaproteobacteria bacterium]
MLNQPKVSVVVPIYGVEKYLHQCVDSILAQTLKDIEIILVDDGSKDKCPEIVDEYAKKDPRIIAVHQPNGGYGRAVNHGIELAKGEYIGIIESDDWIEPTMYEKLYNNAKENNTDITKCMFYVYNSFLREDEQNIIWKDRIRDLKNTPDTVFNVSEYPLIISFHASIWSSIYRTDFIKQQKVIESRSASYQDFPFMIEAMCRAKRITIVKEALVHYRVEDGQNSSTIRRDERLMIMADQCMECKKILKKYNKYEELKEEFYYHAYLACIGFYHTIYMKHKKEFFYKLHNLFSDLAHDKDFKFKYFTDKEKHETNLIINNKFYRTITIRRHLRKLRRFWISFHISKKGVCFQLFGLQYATGVYTQRPAYIKFSSR